MNNRPPTPSDVGLPKFQFVPGTNKIPILIGPHPDHEPMQEALTAEWLISIGAMPDPSDFIWLEIPKSWVCVIYGFDDWNDRYEDKDPDGKPEDYWPCAVEGCNGEGMFCKKVQR